MQILAAETNMLADGLLLLRYVASEPEVAGRAVGRAIGGDLPGAGRLDRFRRARRGSRRFWAASRRRPARRSANLPNEVRIDNEMSDECTVVEVFTIDRRGLLYRLARALHDLGLVIRFAKIGTYLDQVVDVFYVTERDEQKADGEERLAEIRAALTAVITPAEQVAGA